MFYDGIKSSQAVNTVFSSSNFITSKMMSSWQSITIALYSWQWQHNRGILPIVMSLNTGRIGQHLQKQEEYACNH